MAGWGFGGAAESGGPEREGEGKSEKMKRGWRVEDLNPVLWLVTEGALFILIMVVRLEEWFEWI